MSKVVIDETHLTNVANAIRTKGGTSGKLTFPDGMVNAINNIESKSTRKSVAFEATEATNQMKITTSGITTLQSIYITHLDNVMNFSFGEQVVCSLTIILSSSGSSIANGSHFSLCPNDWHWSSYYSLTNRFSIRKYSSYIMIESSTPSSYGWFYGRYSCELFGC